MGAKLCIDMNGPTTTIKDLRGRHDDKPFTFDYSYWSHDGFHEDENGVQIADDEKYCTQQDVFDSLGVLVLNNAFEGFNTSLFAYGQTGSGKSYSMVGYPPNIGIVPMAFDRLFKTIAENTDPNTTFEVTFSMLEVYMEAVADLIAQPSTRKKGGLKVRQNPKLGRFYVEGLTKTAVTSYEQIDALTERGTSHRTVAATKMNATSSRAHTVVTVVLTSKTVKDGQKMTKTSEINLVDLAGSERAGSTGATGDTLKEGAKINQSLSALGNVISALADGKKAPFRDSKLTMLLQNALGGNSKTIMIAAVSPADVNYDESLSTLRYADRAKQIKTKAAVNESPTDKLIRELREANDMMKKQLEQAMHGLAPGALESSDGQQLAAKKAQHAMELQLKLQEEELRQLDGSAYQEQVDAHKQVEAAERRERGEREENLASMAHLANMNEDPHLNGMIIYFLPTGENSIGAVDKDAQRKKRMEKQKYLVRISTVTDALGDSAHPSSNDTATTSAEISATGIERGVADSDAPDEGSEDPNPYIELTGLGVNLRHAKIIVNEDLSATLVPHPDIAANEPENMLVNGKPTREPVELKHHDRIQFGKNHLYLFTNPKNSNMSDSTPPGKIPYELAMEEILANKPPVTHAYGLSADVSALMDKLIPLVEQANEYTKELGKKREWHIKYMSPLYAGLDEGDPTVLIQMVNEDTGNEWYLSPGQFEDRLYSMEQAYRDMDHNYDTDLEDDGDNDDLFEEGQEDMYFDDKTKAMQTRPKTSRPRSTPVASANTDPFSHETANVVIGTVKIPLDGLAYNQMDDDDFFIKDHREKSQGTLEVKVQPCDKERNPVVFRENPDELQGQACYFELALSQAHLKDIRRTRGMKIVYSHPNLGGYKVWAEGDPIIDDDGYKVAGAVQFHSTELLSIPTVGETELNWLLGGAELTAVVVAQQSDDPDFITDQASTRGTMADGIAKIASLLETYHANCEAGDAAQTVEAIAKVLDRERKDGGDADGAASSSPPSNVEVDQLAGHAELATLKKQLEESTVEKARLMVELKAVQDSNSVTPFSKVETSTGTLTGMNVETGASHVGHEDCQGEAKYAEMQKVCGAKDSEISELKTQIILKTAEIGQLVDKCEASDTKLAEVSKAHTQTAANVTEMQSKLSDKLVEVDTLTAKIAELKALPAKTSEQPKSGVCSIM